MKKQKIVLWGLAVALLVLPACRSKEEPTPKPKEPVLKSFTLSRYAAIAAGDGGVEPGELREREVKRYSPKGLLLEEERYDKDANLTGRSLYEYNAQDSLLSEKRYNAQGELIYTEANTYDEGGLLTKVSITSIELPTEEGAERQEYRDNTSYRYNDKRQRIEALNFAQDGSLEQRWEYIYNAEGLRVEDRWIDPETDTMNARIVYSYTPQGFLAEKTSFRGQSEKTSHQRFEYNERELLVKEESQRFMPVFFGGGVVTEIRTYDYSYDDQGKVLRMITFVSDSADATPIASTIEVYDRVYE